MKREEILNEMKAALERYKTIKKEVFYFGMFISNWDNINHCGSVCCLWGWEPKFGVLPVKWDEDNLMRVDKKPQQVIHWGDILYYLYYPSVKDIDVFKKYDTKPNQIIGYELRNDSSLFVVLAAWERVIELIETTNNLDQFLNLHEE